MPSPEKGRTLLVSIFISLSLRELSYIEKSGPGA